MPIQLAFWDKPATYNMFFRFVLSGQIAAAVGADDVTELDHLTARIWS